MVKKLLITAGIIIVVVGALVGTKMLQFKKMGEAGAQMVMPPEVVTATAAVEQDWPHSIKATGSIAAVQGVTVAAELGGKIANIAFESGARVNAGDLLVQIDTSSEEAQLRSADSAVDLAKISLERARELLAKETISKSEFDTAEAQFKQATAQADNIRATIAKKSVRAPFAGRLGLRLVNLGQIVRDGDAITTLQTLDPIYVNFSVPQQRLAALQPGSTVRVSTDAAPGEVFEGKINAVNPEVDPVTRSVRVQATIANAEEKLRAGMFANVDVILPSSAKVLAIPATAVLYAPYGDSVFVVEEKKNEQSGETEKIVRQQFIRLAGTRGDFVAIESGVDSGQTVVTSAPFKLRSGMPVVIDNTLALEAKLAPTPNNT